MSPSSTDCRRLRPDQRTGCGLHGRPATRLQRGASNCGVLRSLLAIGFVCIAITCAPHESAESLTPADTPPLPATPAATAATDAPVAAPIAAPDLQAAFAYSREHQGDAVLVLRDGKEIAADFRSGLAATTPHVLASGTKSFSGIAAVLAVSDGFLDLDERVSDTITEWRGDDAKRDVTVRQLLSLSAGLESLSAVIDNPRNARAAGVTDRAQASIGARSVARPGARFIYGPSSFYVFGELMRRKLLAAGTGDADVVAYLDRRVFGPLGITPRFLRDEAGNANLPGGCRVSARDWAVFGELIRRGGVHVEAEGREIRIIDAAQLDELLRPHGPNARYGLTWWLLRPGDADPEESISADLAADRLEAAGDGPIRRAMRDRLRARAEASMAADAAESGDQVISGYMAAGKGKQRLYVLPDQGLTIVRFGDLNGGREFSDARFLELVHEGLDIPFPQSGGSRSRR